MSSARDHIHLWDNIRGTWSLAVVVAHTVPSFSTPQSGYFRDAGASPIFDFLFVFVRTFRLPMYFVMAGFLAALQYERHGLAATARNRFKRIVVPMVIGWLLMFPLLQLAIAYNLHVAGTARFPGVAETLMSAIANADLDYYWFLYYLLLCYVTVLGVRALVYKVIAERWRTEMRTGFRVLLSSRWAALCFMLASAPTMIADMNTWHLRKLPGLFDTPASLLPVVQVVLGYSVFFAFGWLLYRNRDLLPCLERGAVAQVVLGTLLVPVTIACMYVILSPGNDPGAVERAKWTVVMVSNLACWLLLLGILGFFQRRLSRPVSSLRYLSDASYWIYLTHAPITWFVPPALAGVALPGLIKLPLLVALEAAIVLIPYHFFFRYTVVGDYVIGQRHVRPVSAHSVVA